jgi:hypothetical protein
MGIFSGINTEALFSRDPEPRQQAEQSKPSVPKGRVQRRRSLRQLEDLQRQIQQETAQFREAGAGLLGQFSDLTPGGTQFFQRGLEAGTEQLATQLSRHGLLDSSTAGRAFGELGSSLLGQEELLRQQGLQVAAGLGQTGFGQLGSLAANQFGITSGFAAQMASIPQAPASTAGSDIGGLLGAGAGFALGGKGGALIGGGLGAGLGSLFD